MTERPLGYSSKSYPPFWTRSVTPIVPAFLNLRLRLSLEDYWKKSWNMKWPIVSEEMTLDLLPSFYII
jgi:hypothetical protein